MVKWIEELGSEFEFLALEMSNGHLDSAQHTERPILPSFGNDCIAADISHSSGWNQPMEAVGINRNATSGGVWIAGVSIIQLVVRARRSRDSLLDPIDRNGTEGRGGAAEIRPTIEGVAI